jgi:hypothetical protein
MLGSRTGWMAGNLSPVPFVYYLNLRHDPMERLNGQRAWDSLTTGQQQESLRRAEQEQLRRAV